MPLIRSPCRPRFKVPPPLHEIMSGVIELMGERVARGGLCRGLWGREDRAANSRVQFLNGADSSGRGKSIIALHDRPSGASCLAPPVTEVT